MIESGRFTNINGAYCDFNDAVVPFEEFHTSVDMRMTEIERSQQHGLYPSNTYMGKRLISVSGDILQNTSTDYWTKRLQLIGALMPRPHLGSWNAGTLDLLLSGFTEHLTMDATLDGYPDLPIIALSPSAGKYNINWKALDPRLYGAWQQTRLAYAANDNIGGRTYDKTYNKTYAVASGVGNYIIANSGNIETYPTLEIHGPVVSPQVVLYRSDGAVLFFNLTGLTLATVADYVTVDMLKRSAILNTGANVYNYAVGSSWWALEPAPYVNQIRYLAQGAIDPTSYALINWRNAYMI